MRAVAQLLLLALPPAAAEVRIIITDPSPSPPPPPLSDAVPDWMPLYFLLAVLALYAGVMALVLHSFSGRTGRASAESLPLSGGKEERSHRPRSWMELRRAGVAAPSLEALDAELKKGFVRKVYAILGTQLVLTVAICVGMIYAAFYCGDANYLTSFGHYYLRQEWVNLLSLLVMLGVLCALFSMKNRYPANYILLSVFTALLSLSISRIIIVYYGRGAGLSIVLAFAVTAATFLSLTCFTMLTRVDWNFLQPFLFAGGFLLLFWALLAPLAFCCGRSTSGLSLAVGIVGTILFSGFIIYDTNNIMRYMGIDDYVIAAVELYLDVINLFLCILTIFNASGD
ncbi:hypothetical protein AB1Y20_008733 [Prymnesium parvum]|uniref:Transmembrane BAX inhibitor motif-containing protein 4 n=1 Tax=Prymnesium parvum TaxID=97485 RepID=A0AB34IRC1_PRYPA